MDWGGLATTIGEHVRDRTKCVGLARGVDAPLGPRRGQDTPPALRRSGNAGCKRRGKLAPRVNLQFPEDACQVTFDRTCRYEEGLGDLTVG